MYKMYGITIFIAVSTWLIVGSLLPKEINDHSVGIFLFYGAVFGMTIFGFWWNVINFKSIPMPLPMEMIRIPWAAIALGANCAYHRIFFGHYKTLLIHPDPLMKNIWIGLEIVLTASLIIGIQRWGARHSTLSTVSTAPT